MCGIVGYIGNKPARQIILEGLHRLEYRGYDSAGLTTVDSDGITTFKCKGKVTNLEALLGGDDPRTMGIGHTRWATHGEPNDLNAHPHCDSSGKIALIHNGIVENHSALRDLLISEGRSFKSRTDTEVLVEYISYLYSEGSIPFAEAVRQALVHVVGAYGIAAVCTDEPDLIVAARKGSPLVLGVGDGEMFVASDASPIIDHTRTVVYLDDGDLAEIRRDGYNIISIEQHHQVTREEQEVSLTLDQIEKGGYPHFMLKEILEQVETIPDAMRGRLLLEQGEVVLGGVRDWADRILESNYVYLTACGTSWHAAQIGGLLLEELAGIPARVEYASEFRYRHTVLDSKSTVIAISQSGETADTLAAIKKANEAGALTVGIVNAVGSSIARATDCGIFIHAGPEIGVASTKAFTSQVTVFILLAIYLAQKKGLPIHNLDLLLHDLSTIKTKIQSIIDSADALQEIASHYQNSEHFLYLGRGYQFPIALEGALKLKEISYIHAEGYPAAEMKHGPIALIDENMPVLVMALEDQTYEKVLSNIQEIKSRKGRVIAVTNREDDELLSLADHVITVPTVHRLLYPLLTVIPLQLLAYHIAVARGCNVDQPRNLAKSVTVE
ncbi:MAG: glutamine--fructose-6-phosphate transaminase (isomerizing) [Candidatus Marinimicrobia bacterium]|nr:glutamine--fructose-6-phosphate transaminase (isomerizing) [Candidatus Neomarinimicrobiota bacterium]